MQLYSPGGQPGFNGASSYKQDYPAHPIDPRQPLPQGNYAGPTAPFEGHSSYKQDYPAHALEPRPPAPGGQYQPNSAPFEGSTAYRDTYRGHAIDPAQFARSGPRPPYSPGGGAPFEGASSYRSDYPQHALEPRQAAGRGQYQPNSAPFEGASHYKSDFKAHPLEPRAPVSPPPPHNSAPFDGASHYREDYRAHPLEPRPPAPPARYAPNAAPFQGSTEARDAYQAWPLEPSTLQRQGGPPPMRPSLPFEGGSSYAAEFRGWRLPPRRPALGVQVLGDRVHVLVPAEARLPAAGRAVFTTVHDNQAEICVLVLRGDAAAASRCAVLGAFDLRGLPAGPKGAARVEVELHVDEAGVMRAAATDLDAGRQEAWLRQGSMVARALDPELGVL